jgi:hypothetical protein
MLSLRGGFELTGYLYPKSLTALAVGEGQGQATARHDLWCEKMAPAP